ncbi:putative amidohydrolase [Desulfitispora alkaliphila]|uniref:nitrilase-related carbon-nitrogen hydrolase n=1 Tax=Desulfitispora alkaliphila TaxID=622674 RepID=UPI003D1BBE60
MKLTEKALLQWLKWRSRPRAIEKQVKQLARKDRITPVIKKRDEIATDRVTVAAIQSELILTKTSALYVEEMYRLTKDAVAKGAQLVVFPEDNATQLLGLLPGIDKMAQGDMSSALEKVGGPEVKIGHVFSYLSPVTEQVVSSTFSALAQQFGVYIMTGSAIVAEGERVVNNAYLYGPDGSLIGSQTKAHLLPLEREWGIECGCELKVYQTPLGGVAFPICMDATYFETFRILWAQGAELVLLPTANPDEYNYHKAMRGIWPRVQETPVYGVQSCLVGNIFGLTLTGRAGIFAPMELTEGGDGILAMATSHHREEIVVSTINMDKLREFRKKYARVFNSQLYDKYFPHIYSERQ